MGFLNTVLRVFSSPRDCFSYIQEVSLELCLDIPSAWIGHGAQQHPDPNISTLICHFRVLGSSLSTNQECAAPPPFHFSAHSWSHPSALEGDAIQDSKHTGSPIMASSMNSKSPVIQIALNTCREQPVECSREK